MKIEQRLSHLQQQKLILTPQLRQALHILQLPLLDLKALIENELIENPVLEEEPLTKEETSLEERPSFDEIEKTYLNESWEESFSTFSHSAQTEEEEKRTFAETSLKKPLSLQDHLLWQLKLSVEYPEEEKIGETIIGNIDENGYLQATTAEIAQALGVSEEKINQILSLIQEFEPTGVGARDLKECLLIQLKYLDKEDSLAARLIRDHLPEIEKKKWQELAHHLRLPLDKIKEGIHFISTLEPKPGRKFSSALSFAIIPDVIVRKVGDRYQVFLNSEDTPRLRLSPKYKNILQDSKDPSAREFIEKKLQGALWLIKSINQRQQTIIKAAEAIIQYQSEFMEKGMDYLKPCTLSQIAAEIGMHESTVSRALSQKYMETPQGLYEFKTFFSKEFIRREGPNQSESRLQSLASNTIKEKIKTLIENEDPTHPLSDEGIKEKFTQEGITIARRTIAKYREALRILPTHLRKK